MNSAYLAMIKRHKRQHLIARAIGWSILAAIVIAVHSGLYLTLLIRYGV